MPHPLHHTKIRITMSKYFCFCSRWSPQKIASIPALFKFARGNTFCVMRFGGMTNFSNQFIRCMFNSKGTRAKMAAFGLTAMDAPPGGSTRASPCGSLLANPDALRCHCRESCQIARCYP